MAMQVLNQSRWSPFGRGNTSSGSAEDYAWESVDSIYELLTNAVDAPDVTPTRKAQITDLVAAMDKLGNSISAPIGFQRYEIIKPAP